MQPLYRIRSLRRPVLAALRRMNLGDVRIKHHYTGLPLQLHSYRHKGYWYHGRRRERETVELYMFLVRPGQVVLEAGANIGYQTQIFSQMVGASGQVVAFEPDIINLPYLMRNTTPCRNVVVEHVALSDCEGEGTIYVDTLTGQNSSLVAGFDVFRTNRARAYDDRATVIPTAVAQTTLDRYLERRRISPDFLKIDVEGGELRLLQGAQSLVERHRPVLMVEIQPDNAAEVAELLSGHGYVPLPARSVAYAPTDGRPTGNTFFLHAEHHHRQLRNLPAWGALRRFLP